MLEASIDLPELGVSYRETAVKTGSILGPLCVVAQSDLKATLRSTSVSTRTGQRHREVKCVPRTAAELTQTLAIWPQHP